MHFCWLLNCLAVVCSVSARADDSDALAALPRDFRSQHLSSVLDSIRLEAREEQILDDIKAILRRHIVTAKANQHRHGHDAAQLHKRSETMEDIGPSPSTSSRVPEQQAQETPTQTDGLSPTPEPSYNTPEAAVSPRSDAQPTFYCEWGTGLLFWFWEIDMKGWDMNKVGQYGGHLLKAIRGCGDVTAWEFQKSSVEKWDYYASGRLPLGSPSGCLEKKMEQIEPRLKGKVGKCHKLDTGGF